MSIDEVVEVVRNETEWKVLRQVGWRPLSSLSEDEIQSYIDDRIEVGRIGLFLGRSFGFNSVSASWKFDENGKLIDVNVEKYLAI